MTRWLLLDNARPGGWCRPAFLCLASEPDDELALKDFKNLYRDDAEILDLLDRVVGRPIGSNQHDEGVDNVHTLAGRPTGNTKAAAVGYLVMFVYLPSSCPKSAIALSTSLFIVMIMGLIKVGGAFSLLI